MGQLTLVKSILSVNLAVASVLGLFVLSLVMPASVLASDQFSAEVQLKENNEYTDVIEYEPSTLILNQNEFCPNSNCEYDIYDGGLTHNTYGSDWRHFEGTIEVIRHEGNAKDIKLYPFESDLSISEIRKTGDRVVEILDGEISFGRNAYDPDFKYLIKNGTFTLEGNKATLSLSGNST